MSRGRKQGKAEDSLAGLPDWAQKLARKYYTRTVSTFLLYGAVRDLQPLTTDEGGRAYGPLRTFLADELFGGRDHVLFYDRSSGVRAGSGGTGATPCTRSTPGGRSMRSTPPASRLVSCDHARTPGASVMTAPATRPNQSNPLTAVATSRAVARPQPPWR